MAFDQYLTLLSIFSVLKVVKNFFPVINSKFSFLYKFPNIKVSFSRDFHEQLKTCISYNAIMFIMYMYVYDIYVYKCLFLLC